ncbi:MAG: MotA/TolQ/ExbB proton channel family protein [Planctomycetes bacterium]|nr:MotA/TolQ/ExbB proton channel family protein [Planctomycetota bacterium]
MSRARRRGAEGARPGRTAAAARLAASMPVAAAVALCPGTVFAGLEAGSAVGDPALWDLVQAAGLPGGLISALLVIALVIIADCAQAMREVNFCPPELGRRLERLFGERRFLEALAQCRAEHSVLARAIERALLAVEYGSAQARRVADRATESAADELGRRASYLAVLGAIAGLLGFFGLFAGAIEAFAASVRDAGSPLPHAYAGGIYQALVVPLEGALTAVVCLLGFFVFATRARALRLRTALTVTELLGRLDEPQVAAAGAPGSAPGAPGAPGAATEAGTDSRAGSGDAVLGPPV